MPRISLWPALLVLTITFIAFIPSLSNGFLNWDDNLFVVENKSIETLDWAHVKTIFTTKLVDVYDPITVLSFAIERHFVGLDPRLYHIDNLILHLTCVFLAFVFLRKLDVSTWAAVFGSLLFGIHPMHVESVAWVTERKDVLYGAFYLGALIAYVSYLHNNYAKKHFAIAIVLFAFSLLSKIQAVTLPLSMLAIDYYFKRPLRFRVLAEKMPFFLMSLTVGCLGVFLLSDSGTFKQNAVFSLIERLLIGAFSFCIYLVKVVVPYAITPVYPYPAKFSAAFYLAPLGIVAVFWLLWAQYRRGNRAVIFGFAFFIANIVFVLQVLGAGQFLADRYSYIAYLGLFFIVTKLFESAIANKKWTSIVTGAGIIYVGIFAVITWNQCAIWKDSVTFWTAISRKYPQDPRAYHNSGFGNRDIEVIIHNSLGKAYSDLGQTQQAIADFTKALEFDPSYAEGYVNRGAAYAVAGQYDLALADLNKGVELDPKSPMGYLNRSLLYRKTDKLDLAIADYDTYLKLNPGNLSIAFHRAVAKREAGRSADAIADFDGLVRDHLNQIDEHSLARLYLERSLAYHDLGKRDEALRDAKMAKASGLDVDDQYLQQLQQ